MYQSDLEYELATFKDIQQSRGRGRSTIAFLLCESPNLPRSGSGDFSAIYVLAQIYRRLCKNIYVSKHNFLIGCSFLSLFYLLDFLLLFQLRSHSIPTLRSRDLRYGQSDGSVDMSTIHRDSHIQSNARSSFVS